MVAFFIFLFGIGIHGLKTWVPDTGINNSLNWDVGDRPNNCDNVFFPLASDVATSWNILDIAISGLSLPSTGEIIFLKDISLKFKDKAQCSRARDIKYNRSGVKGWLDPDNWKSEDDNDWLPHSARVPCAGEEINFPSDSTIAVQLPTILLPIKSINFGDEEFNGEDWHNFLNTDMGFKLFKGPKDTRDLAWRTDMGCSNRKTCTCTRSTYTIRDGLFKNINPKIFEEAVCLYAMPKCSSSKCYSPVVPEGHCCGICGAVLKLEDNTEEGLNLFDIRVKIRNELKSTIFGNELKIYVGRTLDGNIQIVVKAKDSSMTINSHAFSNIIARRLTEQKVSTKIISHLSGLTFSNYIFNSISGIVFGTLIAILFLFIAVFYTYIILPKKELNLGRNKPFVFARFDNKLNGDGCDDNLEIDIEPQNCHELPQAFDNPIYSANYCFNNIEEKEFNDSESKESDHKTLDKISGTQEYHNLVYNDINKLD